MLPRDHFHQQNDMVWLAVGHTFEDRLFFVYDIAVNAQFMDECAQWAVEKTEIWPHAEANAGGCTHQMFDRCSTVLPKI